MACSIPWAQDFFYNFSEKILFGGHPVKTARAYVTGRRVHSVGAFARRTGLDRDLDYSALVRKTEGPDFHGEKPFDIIGRAYYDAWHDETVIAITARRMMVPHIGRPYPKNERKTFAVPGNRLADTA